MNNDSLEVCLNLWFVVDKDTRLIYRAAARVYALTGTDDEKAKILNKVPSKKFGNTKDIVSAIEFIINTEYLNGAQTKIDGGIQ